MKTLLPFVGMLALLLGVVCTFFANRVLAPHQRLGGWTDSDIRNSLIFRKSTYLRTVRLSGVVAIIIGLGFVGSLFFRAP